MADEPDNQSTIKSDAENNSRSFGMNPAIKTERKPELKPKIKLETEPETKPEMKPAGSNPSDFLDHPLEEVQESEIPALQKNGTSALSAEEISEGSYGPFFAILHDWKYTPAGKWMHSIPTPVVLTVLFLSMMSFGIYLWQYGKELTLIHISKGIILLIVGIVLVCTLILVYKHQDQLSRLLHARSFLESRYYRYRHDVVYKIRITLFCSLVVNILFVLMKTTSGLLYHSAWFITLAVYYFLLAMLRFILLMYLQKPESEDSELLEWRRYRWVGAVLLVMNHVLIGMTGYMVANQNAFVYPGLLLYGMAAYTAYTLASALYSLYRFRKYGAPVLSAAKIVSLTAALVSMLALESASVTAFGGIFRKDHTDFTAAIGSLVCALVLMLSIYMLIHSTHKISQIRRKAA